MCVKNVFWATESCSNLENTLVFLVPKSERLLKIVEDIA